MLEKNRPPGNNSEQSVALPYRPKKNSIEAKLREGKLKNNIMGRKILLLAAPSVGKLIQKWY